MEQVRASVEEAVNIIKNGGMVILTDDETRENEEGEEARHIASAMLHATFLPTRPCYQARHFPFP